MTQPPVGLPPHLLPRSKAPPTSSSTNSLHAVSRSNTPQISRASSRNRQELPKVTTPATSVDVSAKATAALVRRVLCPHAHVGPSDNQPIDELLPPLTSSNDIDLQFYAIIAIVVREFIYSWYGKITPDQGFVEEVVRIFAHCTRALEQRTRKVDIEGLILDEIPQLVQEHISAFGTSHRSPYPPSLSITADSRAVYHTLIPHPAFSPVPDLDLPRSVEEQSSNEGVYRQLLVHGALAVLLPTEDLGNKCLRTLVADIMGEMILGNGISNKACEGWLLWDGITKIAQNLKKRVEPKTTGEEMELKARGRLEKFGLLSERNGSTEPDITRRRTSSLSEILWRMLQYGYLTFFAMRFIVTGLLAAYSRPSRRTSPGSNYNRVEEFPLMDTTTALTLKRPILRFKIFSLISILLDLSNRTPWLLGSISLLQHHLIRRPLRLGATGGLVDNFLRNLLSAHVFQPDLLPSLLLTLRTALFPNNALAPPRVVPSLAEQAIIKRRCAEAILELIPPIIAGRFFATRYTLPNKGYNQDKKSPREDTGPDVGKEQMLAEIEQVLDVFGDSYMNKHLIFGIVELVIIRLMPEVAEMSVRELMETRLGEGWEEGGGGL